MRVLIIADVHANWEALLALQRAESKPDAVLFAGDAVGYGPDSVNCVRWLVANATLAVRGNHDESLLHAEPIGMVPELAEAARATIDLARLQLLANNVAIMQHWKLTNSAVLAGARFYLVHGSPAHPLNGWISPATTSDTNLHALFDDIHADVIVLGHTHLPAMREFDGKLILNPGSLGQPRYGAPDATYAVWDDGRVQIKHLHYDHDPTIRKLRLTPLSPEVTETLADVLETGLAPEGAME